MQLHSEVRFDSALALSQGAREHQEDAIIADFPMGSDTGFVVLADGMGGHAAGDMASKIVMTEVFCELKFQSGAPEGFAEAVPETLRRAMEGANDCLAAHIAENPQARGMGATLIAAVLHKDRLHWISVGDSPLYLFRDGRLMQLNEDHSMGPQIDMMADSGLIDSSTARDHPDRNALLSVLCGEEVQQIDCPDAPYAIRHGDLLIVASDGLQFLDDAQIADLVAANRGRGSAAVTRALLDALGKLDDPDQDNISIAVIGIGFEAAEDAFADAMRSAFDFAEAFEPEEEEDAPAMAEMSEAEATDLDDPAEPEPVAAAPHAPDDAALRLGRDDAAGEDATEDPANLFAPEETASTEDGAGAHGTDAPPSDRPETELAGADAGAEADPQESRDSLRAKPDEAVSRDTDADGAGDSGDAAAERPGPAIRIATDSRSPRVRRIIVAGGMQ